MLFIPFDEDYPGGLQRPLNAKQSLDGDAEIVGAALDSFDRGHPQPSPPRKFSLTNVQEATSRPYLARVNHCPFGTVERPLTSPALRDTKRITIITFGIISDAFCIPR